MPKSKKFGSIVLASTGDFLGDKDSKIKGWVEHAGGTFAKELSKDVTHLLCSEKAWKRYYPIGMPPLRRRHNPDTDGLQSRKLGE